MPTTPSGLHADGTTDDSATINTAIATLGSGVGGELYLPAGNYAVGNSAGIVLKANVKLVGDGFATTLVALSTCTDAVITTDSAAYNYGVSSLTVDGRYYSGGGVCHGIHVTTSNANPALESKFVPGGKASTYGQLGYYLPGAPLVQTASFDHIAILHTYGHSIYVDSGVTSLVFDAIYATGAGGAVHSSFDAEACNLAVNSATDCFFSNMVLGCAYAASVYLLDAGDIQIINSKMWNPGLYWNATTGANETVAIPTSTLGCGIVIDGSGHHLISNCETQYVPGVALTINGSFGNKVDLLAENSAYADILIEGDSYDNDLDVRGRGDATQPAADLPAASVIYSGTSIVAPNRVKYRRDADLIPAGYTVPLWALQGSATFAEAQGLNLGDAGFGYEGTATTWNPPDLQSADVFFFQPAASATVTLDDLPTGTVEPGKVVTIVVQQAGGNTLAYGTSTWYSQPALPAGAGIYTFRFCNMSSSATPYWIQI